MTQYSDIIVVSSKSVLFITNITLPKLYLCLSNCLLWDLFGKWGIKKRRNDLEWFIIVLKNRSIVIEANSSCLLSYRNYCLLFLCSKSYESITRVFLEYLRFPVLCDSILTQTACHFPVCST